MEPEIAALLKKLLWTIVFVIAWMWVNILVGIFWGYGLIEPGHTAGTVLFYGWFVASIFLGLRLYRRFWGAVG